MSSGRELVVPDACVDPAWANNPDIKLGMISYCGLPLTWPDGRIFGTICVLDATRNDYGQLYRRLLARFASAFSWVCRPCSRIKGCKRHSLP